MFLGVKVEKVSIFLVLSLQTHLLANDEVSVLPLLIHILNFMFKPKNHHFGFFNGYMKDHFLSLPMLSKWEPRVFSVFDKMK